MNQQDWFYQTNDFLETVSGIDELGKPKASLLLRIGGGEDTQAITVDLGRVTMNKRNMQGCYMITLSFAMTESLRRCTEQFEKYAKYVDIVSGAVDDNHMLSVIIMESNEIKTGYIIGMNPVFFAQTASKPLGQVDSYRIAFRKDCIFYYGIDDLENEDGDREASGYLGDFSSGKQPEQELETQTGIWNGFS